MAKTLTYLFGFIKIAFLVEVLTLSMLIILLPAPSIALMRLFAGSIGILLLTNHEHLANLNFVQALRKDFKLVHYQTLILNEIKANNDKITAFMTTQADTLAKMTSIAVKKSPEDFTKDK
jgi:hypothetical protein